MPDFEITGEETMRSLARDLRQAGEQGKQLRTALRKEIQVAVKPMQDEAKQNVLAIPSRHHGAKSLRKAVARAIKVRIRMSSAAVQVRLEVSGKALERAGYPATLGPYLEGTSRRPWRHPVFGNTDAWVTQQPHSYFYSAVQSHLPGVQAAIERAVDSITDRLNRGN